MRSLLLEAIETLKPGPSLPFRSREWRSYLILHYRYVEGMSSEGIQEELSLSLRQVQREQQKALMAVAQVLWDRHGGPDASPHDLLEEELQRIESHPENVLLDEAIREAWATVQVVAVGSKSMDLVWRGGDRTTRVLVDPGLLHQGLVNLLRSALEETRGSIIELQVTTDHERAELILAGEDGSVGENTERGLKVARRLIERNGGRVWLVTEGKRLEWHLSLPIVGPYTVLVIDDNEAAIHLFERYLTGQEFRVIGARDGETALRLATEAQPREPTRSA